MAESHHVGQRERHQRIRRVGNDHRLDFAFGTHRLGCAGQGTLDRVVSAGGDHSVGSRQPVRLDAVDIKTIVLGGLSARNQKVSESIWCSYVSDQRGVPDFQHAEQCHFCARH